MASNLKLYLVLGIFLGICLAGIYLLPDTRQSVNEPERWILPESLHEASGLAAVSPSIVVVHNDEDGIVYRFNLDSGNLHKMLALGADPVKDDFEGIEVVGNDLYMVTSKGLIYKVAEAMTTDAQRASFEVFDTNLADICEIEGLVLDQGALLLPCKDIYARQYKDMLTVFAWSLETQNVSLRFSAPFDTLGIKGRIHGTAIEANLSHYLIVAGREHLLAVIDKDGLATEVVNLSRETHPQAEGIALMEDGAIVLADEGTKGTLTRYQSIGQVKRATGRQ